MASVDLPDINVWIALSDPNNIHYARAKRYWSDEVRDCVAFNTHTMLGMVRILSTVRLVGPSALPPEEAWSLYLMWQKDPAVIFVAEPKNFAVTLDRFVRSGIVTANGWSDAYLAAFAMAGSMRLVSFDSDFQRFPGLNWLHL